MFVRVSLDNGSKDHFQKVDLEIQARMCIFQLGLSKGGGTNFIFIFDFFPLQGILITIRLT